MSFCIKNVNIELSAAAVLVFAAFAYVEKSTELAALIVTVTVHELAHLTALKLCGARIRKIEFTLNGLNIDFFGSISEKEELISALAGPVGGLLLTVLCKTGGRGVLLTETGRLSAYLSAFNLLPTLPLDGGRAFCILLRFFFNAELCRRFMQASRTVVSVLMMGIGVCLISSGSGLLLIFAALRILLIFDL